MQKIEMSCPFCGLEFQALQTADNDIIFTHALTGENVKMNFNNSIKKFNISKSMFRHVKLINTLEACEIVGVSKMAISKAVNNGLIKAVNVNGTYLYTLDSVLEYKKKRETE